MANINFSAPVIRLGSLNIQKPGVGATPAPVRRDADASLPASSSRPSDRPERGQADHGRVAAREAALPLMPPTRDEITRTVFIGNITDGMGGGDGLQKLLAAVGRVRRWDPATGPDGKPMTFGFAMFEDAESLATAMDLLSDVEVPTKRQPAAEKPQGDRATDPVNKTKLLFTVDKGSKSYIQAWKESRGEESAREPDVEAARTRVKRVLEDMFFPPKSSAADGDGDVPMSDAAATGGNENVEVVNIPLAQEDELADIPAEMRETVASEIAAFRDRSHQRDLERLRQEEEFEAAERERNDQLRRQRPLSPSSGANGSAPPAGPRGVPNAPSGPRAQDRVSFVHGSANDNTANGPGHADYESDDPSEASDEELQQRLLQARQAEDLKAFDEAERRWLNRERSRQAALERERDRDAAELEKERKMAAQLADRLKTWDEEKEAARKTEAYYRDRAGWLRDRTAFRSRESAADEADRRAEAAQKARIEAETEAARGMADSFLDAQAAELASSSKSAAAAAPAPQQPFKLSLGAAAQRNAARTAPRRAVDVEGLLEDEEEAGATRRVLIPIRFDPADLAASGGAGALSEEENTEKVRALAAEIPADMEGLWAREVAWDYLDDSMITSKLRPFVEKKIVDYLGVQEQLLVDVVEECLRNRGQPGKLVEELAEALDDEAEDMVRKLWRMLIFYTEGEKRGLQL